MATQLQIRRGTSTQVAAFTGAEGEIVVNTTNDSVHVNDGSTQGGFELARVDGANWNVTNNISTTGNVTIGSVASGTSTSTPVELNLGSTFADSAGSLSKAKLKIFEDSSANVYGLSVSSGLFEFGVPSSAAYAFFINESEKMRLTSTGLGIGTSSVDATIHGAGTQASGDVPFIFENAATSGVATASLVFAGNGGSGAEKARIKSAVFGDGYMAFHNNDDSEKMRILADGTFLVGKTADDNSVGFKTNTSSTYMVANTATPVFINRLGNVGDLLEFRQDSSAIGSIGTVSGSLSLGSGDCYLEMSGTGNVIQPMGSVTGAASNGVISLGASGRRFLDLYLGGGAYLGGTTSANYLDDYEQGSWTTTTTGISGVTVTSANYTKIGQLVSCDMRVQWTSSSQDGTLMTFSLPFASSNPGGSPARTGLVFYQGTTLLGGNAIAAHVSQAATVVAFYNAGGGTFRAILASDVNGSYDWLVSFTYFTNL